jgi:UDP-N-acetylmuramoyl-L-alanyl-D-glutamate--2,6-diaminopimelate ligase
MRLQKMLAAITPLKVAGDIDFDITKICFDSREVIPGALFVAQRGTQVDGHNYLEQALQAGAKAVVVEAWPETLDAGEVAVITVADTKPVLGRLADQWYQHPSRHLRVVGVTGTNGKTTTVTLMYDLLTALGYKCGLISTIRNRVGSAEVEATHTTPDALQIQALLADMVEAGCDYVFMEVSSHAVHQERIAGLDFAGAIFTNITHDHLDYHGTFANYLAAKKAFFDGLSAKAFALVNVDDRRGDVMVQNTRASVYRYSLRKMADFRGRILENSINGLHLVLDGTEVITRLIGAFNAYNALAAYAAARLLGLDAVEVMTSLSGLKAAEGRFDALQALDKDLTAIVDYAHTPDALEKILTTLQEVRSGQSQILTVVGCGGDRDKTKRPKMAAVASGLSDQVILTSDNPRTEDPLTIIRDMEAGIPAEKRSTVLSIADRRQAIRTACRIARAGDIILVAGKGHETYQEINGVKHPFDDKEVLKEELLG